METNPYRIEEQLWTPAPVYDVHPPNTLDYSSFDFLQGSDGYDEGKVKNSLWEGFKQFFEDAFGTLGKIVGGAIEFGVGVFRAFAEGVTKLLGFIGKAVGDIFKGPKVTPLPPIFNPIKTNLEEALEPYLDKIENASTTINNSVAKQEDLNAQIKALDVRMANNFDKLEENNQEYAQIKEEFDTLSAAAAQQEAELKRIGEETDKAVKEARQIAEDRATAEKTLRNEIADSLRKAESAQASADGKSTIYYGTKAPMSPKNGDAWFKKFSGGSEILVFQSGQWVQKTDWAKVNADLAANKEAVDQATSDVADAQAKIKHLTEEELPAISEGTAEFNRKLAEETEARKRELTEANKALTQAKKDLGKSMSDLETRLKDADSLLKSTLGDKITNDLGDAKRELADSMKQLDTQLKEADKELDRLGTARAGNVWPDPHFKDPCWVNSDSKGSHPNNGGEFRLTGIGAQTGMYYQPEGHKDKALMLEKGGKYLLTATVYRNSTLPNDTTVSVYLRQPGPYLGKVGLLPTGPVGISVESVILDIPDTIVGGGSTLGFFLERWVPDGFVSIWDVQIVRAADNAMIIDGAVTAGKILAGSVDTAHLNANAVTADKIKAGQVVAGKLAANSVTASNLQADSVTANKIKSGQILTEHIKAGQVTANEIASNAITAKQIAAGTITANELASNSVTTKQLTANSVNASALQTNSVKAEHIVAKAITGDKISANTITGDNVLANSITSSELQIRPGNLFPDPEFQDPYWTEHQSHEVVKAWGRNCLHLLANGSQTGRYYRPKNAEAYPVRLEPGSSYRLTCWARFSTNKVLTSVSVYIRYYRPDGSIATHKMGVIPRESQVSFGTGGTVSTLLSTPDDMDRPDCTIGFFTERWYDSGDVYLADVQLLRAADASLIVNGAILAKHVKAGEITSNEIAADTITGRNLKADQITGREIKSGTINASQLTVDNGFIKNAMIADATIEASKIKTLDANKITSGTISGKRIDADSITVRQIRANSIIPIGGSLIHHEPPPEDDTKPPEPIWWQVCDLELSENYPGYPRPEGNPWRTAKVAAGNKVAPSIPKRLVKVKPGQKYRMKVWLRATKSGSTLWLNVCDQNGNRATVYGAPHGGADQAEKRYYDRRNDWDVADFTGSSRASNTGRLLENYEVPTARTLVTSTVWFDESVEYIYLERFHFNERGEANQWIAGLSLELDIPDQAEVDKAQNNAIDALNQFRDQNTKLDIIQGNMINKNHKLANTNRTAIQVLEDSVKGLEDFRIAQIKWNDEQKNINKSVSSAFDSIEELQRKQAEYIVRVMHRPAGQSFYDDYISVSAGGTVTAKNAWGGEAIIDMTREAVVNVSSGDGYVNVDKRSIKQVHVGTQRTLLAGSWDTKNADMIINYWVYQGTPQSKTVNCPTGYITGSSYRSSSWTEVGSITVPPTNGSTTINWKIKLTAADRECVYGMRIKIDGAYNSSNQATWEGVGPLGPLGDGNYEMNRIFSLPLSETKSQTLTFETYFRPGSGDGSSQAKASINSAKVMYIKSNG